MSISESGKRASLIYLIFEMYGAIVVGGLFYLLNGFGIFGGLTDVIVNPVWVAAINSLFRIVAVILELPLLRVWAAAQTLWECFTIL